MDIVIHCILLFICVVISAACSGSETALFAIPKSEIDILEKKHGTKGTLIKSHLSKPAHLLFTILSVNMFVNIFSTSLSERLATHFFHENGLGISIIVTSLLIILFGEISPKVIAVNYYQKISLSVISYVHFAHTVITPFRIIFDTAFHKTIDWLSHCFGKERKATYAELKSILIQSQKAGILFAHEKNMLEGVLRIQRLRIKDIMTPRTSMVCFDIEDSFEKILANTRNKKFSRIPFYSKKLDNIVGILYIKDILGREERDMQLAPILRKPYFVPETQYAGELFRAMRRSGNHQAIVVDEYGGVEGLITMEDILEEIFGDILDKKDVLLSLQKISTDSMKISGKLLLTDFNEIFHTSLHDKNCVTIGGHLISLLGYIPIKGEQLEFYGMKFVISRSKKNRIEEIIVTKKG